MRRGQYGVDRNKVQRDPETHLNKNATFDTFVPGDSNRFARTVALAVAEGSGKDFNPLCIYGGSGLGKTHLLNAIGNYALVKDPTLKVRYVNSEEFLERVHRGVADSFAKPGRIAGVQPPIPQCRRAAHRRYSVPWRQGKRPSNSSSIRSTRYIRRISVSSSHPTWPEEPQGLRGPPHLALRLRVDGGCQAAGSGNPYRHSSHDGVHEPQQYPKRRARSDRRERFYGEHSRAEGALTRVTAGFRWAISR